MTIIISTFAGTGKTHLCETLQKYCEPMKLNVHDGASYVIARRYFELD